MTRGVDSTFQKPYRGCEILKDLCAFTREVIFIFQRISTGGVNIMSLGVYIDMDPKFQIPHWDQDSSDSVFAIELDAQRPQEVCHRSR